MKKSKIRLLNSKKADVLQDGVFMLVFMILIVTGFYSSAHAASKAGFLLGEHESRIFEMAQDADRLGNFIDEAARQSLIIAIFNVSSNPGSNACGKYLNYTLLNSLSQDSEKDCMIDKRNEIERMAKEKILKTSMPEFITLGPGAAIKSDAFSSRLMDAGALTIFSMSSQNPVTFVYPQGEYSITPSGEAAINFNLSHLKILDKAVADLRQCRDEACLRTTAKKWSLPDFKIQLGNCEDWKTASYGTSGDDEIKSKYDYANLEKLKEEVNDCMDSKDNDCACELNTQKQDYNVALQNDDDGIKMTAYKGLFSSWNPLESIILNDVHLESSFEIPFDGAPETIIKKDGKLFLADDSDDKKSCAIEKTEYRFCALTGKSFMVFDEGSQKIQKKDLSFKFAIEIAKD